MNSKIEKMSDLCHPNLLKMPDVVMEEVLKNLDFRSIIRLRKVCRKLRSSIDQINPEMHLADIKFKVSLTISSIKSNIEGVDDPSKKMYMKHITSRAGCTIKWQQENIYRSVVTSMEEAESLLKNTKLDHLHINLHFSRGDSSVLLSEKEEEDLKRIYENMKSRLENKIHCLRAREIYFEADNLSETARFLKCVDSNSLKYISINVRGNAHRAVIHVNDFARGAIEMNFSELEALEQWKNAEKLKIVGNYILTPIESFASFKTITIRVDRISIEKLNEVKELFVRSPKMKSFIIKSPMISRMKDQILSNFGRFHSYDEKLENDHPDHAFFHMHDRGERRFAERTWKWLKNLPDSAEQLQIILNIRNVLSENRIELSKIKPDVGHHYFFQDWDFAPAEMNEQNMFDTQDL